MAERRAIAHGAPHGDLLDRVDSKFTLVTLAAMRAREINDYYNQLGEGLGKIVPPQVTSVSRKPLSIALEEIEVGKIEAVPLPTEESRAPRPSAAAAAVDADAEPPRPEPEPHADGADMPSDRCRAARPARRARRVRRDRRLQGGRGLPPPGRRRRARHAGPHRGRAPASSARSRSPRSRPSRRARRCSTAPEPIPHTRLGQTADLVIVAPATAKLLGKYAAGISDDLLTATLLATRAPVLVAPGDAHRDVGAPGGAGEPRDAAPPGRARGRPRVRPARRRRRRRGPPRRPGRSWPRRPSVLRRGPATSPGCGCSSPPAAPASRSTRCGFIGNRSSGKMGYAVAEVAARRGAAVTLVTTIGRPRAAGASRSCRSRRPRRCRTRCWPAAPTSTWS